MDPENPDIDAELQAKFDEGHFSKTDDHDVKKRLVKRGLASQMNFKDFDQSKMTFKERSELYKANSFPRYMETVGKYV